MTAQQPGEEDPGSVWVNSDVAADGTYLVTVSLGEDSVWPVVRPLEYAAAVVMAAELAEYDAAIVAQLTSLGTPIAAAGQLVADLRRSRAEPDPEATAPMAFMPGVSMRTRKAFITVTVAGEPYGQWDVTDAHRHALHVLGAATVVKLDDRYRELLVRLVKVDDDTARSVVAGLDRFRDGVR